MELLLGALMMTAQVDLAPVLRFSAPALCELGEPLSGIVERMTSIDPETWEGRRPPPIAVPGFDAPIAVRFERRRTIDDAADERHVTVDLSLAGRWHGLRVIRLRRSFVEESDSSAVEIHFAERPARVRSALNRAGFRLLRPGRWREVEGEDGIGQSIAVIPIEEGAALSCVIG